MGVGKENSIERECGLRSNTNAACPKDVLAMPQSDQERPLRPARVEPRAERPLRPDPRAEEVQANPEPGSEPERPISMQLFPNEGELLEL